MGKQKSATKKKKTAKQPTVTPPPKQEPSVTPNFSNLVCTFAGFFCLFSN
jgi:hypothetical protein